MNGRTHNWEQKRLKFVARLSYGDAMSAEARRPGPVEVFGSNGAVGTHDEANTGAPVILVGRKGSYGKLNYSETPVFCIDTAYHVSRLDSSVDLRFLFYALHCLELDKNSQDTGVPGLSREHAYQKILAIPPGPTQKTIATFLDRETARLDSLISAKNALLSSLSDLRSSATTQILLGEQPSCPTANPWIPSIQAGEQLKKLKHLGQVRSGIALGKKRAPNNLLLLPYLRVANVQDGRVDLSDITTIEVTQDEADRYALLANDVLMNEGGDYDKVGRGAVWQGQIEPCLHQNHVFAVRMDDPEMAEWVSAITRTAYAKFYFMNNSKQSTNLASISQKNIKELPVVVPPRDERVRRLAQLNRELAKISELETHVRAEIDTLSELRSATITDAVLGHIDLTEFQQATQVQEAA